MPALSPQAKHLKLAALALASLAGPVLLGGLLFWGTYSFLSDQFMVWLPVPVEGADKIFTWSDKFLAVGVAFAGSLASIAIAYRTFLNQKMFDETAASVEKKRQLDETIRRMREDRLRHQDVLDSMEALFNAADAILESHIVRFKDATQGREAESPVRRGVDARELKSIQARLWQALGEADKTHFSKLELSALWQSAHAECIEGDSTWMTSAGNGGAPVPGGTRPPAPFPLSSGYLRMSGLFGLGKDGRSCARLPMLSGALRRSLISEGFLEDVDHYLGGRFQRELENLAHHIFLRRDTQDRGAPSGDKSVNPREPAVSSDLDTLLIKLDESYEEFERKAGPMLDRLDGSMDTLLAKAEKLGPGDEPQNEDAQQAYDFVGAHKEDLTDQVKELREHCEELRKYVEREFSEYHKQFDEFRPLRERRLKSLMKNRLTGTESGQFFRLRAAIAGMILVPDMLSVICGMGQAQYAQMNVGLLLLVDLIRLYDSERFNASCALLLADLNSHEGVREKTDASDFRLEMGHETREHLLNPVIIEGELFMLRDEIGNFTSDNLQSNVPCEEVDLALSGGRFQISLPNFNILDGRIEFLVSGVWDFRSYFSDLIENESQKFEIKIKNGECKWISEQIDNELRRAEKKIRSELERKNLETIVKLKKEERDREEAAITKYNRMFGQLSEERQKSNRLEEDLKHERAKNASLNPSPDGESDDEIPF